MASVGDAYFLPRSRLEPRATARSSASSTAAATESRASRCARMTSSDRRRGSLKRDAHPALPHSRRAPTPSGRRASGSSTCRASIAARSARRSDPAAGGTRSGSPTARASLAHARDTAIARVGLLDEARLRPWLRQVQKLQVQLLHDVDPPSEPPCRTAGQARPDASGRREGQRRPCRAHWRTAFFARAGEAREGQMAIRLGLRSMATRASYCRSSSRRRAACHRQCSSGPGARCAWRRISAQSVAIRRSSCDAQANSFPSRSNSPRSSPHGAAFRQASQRRRAHSGARRSCVAPSDNGA